MRLIALDTETTGLSPLEGHKIVEIGAVEILDGRLTGKEYSCYLDPCRSVPEEVVKIHGLSDDFLKGKPLFKEIMPAFLSFLGESPLIIHNAPFDLSFLKRELEESGEGELKNEVIDTLQIAREKLPGQRVSLDSLCVYYGVDLSKRTKHGALLDAQLLAEVYRKMCLEKAGEPEEVGRKEAAVVLASGGDEAVIERRGFVEALTEEELRRRKELLLKIESPLWEEES